MSTDSLRHEFGTTRAASTAPKAPDAVPIEKSVGTPTPAATQINFRADAETKAALEELSADGTPVSEVIRSAIKGARRAARKAQAVAEMEAIMSDPAQRAISEQVYRDMSNLDAW